jgi:hypothetical protein
VSGEGLTARIWGLITDRAAGDAVSIRHLCAACVAAVAVDGAALWVASDPDRRALLYATDRVAGGLDDLQFTLGEGPSMQAWTERGMVLADDLGSPDSTGRWPVFAPAAISAGAGAIFAFPLQVGAIRVGVLCLYRARPGPMSGEQLADTLAFTFAAVTLVLDQGQPVSSARIGRRSPGSEQGAWPLDGLGQGQAEIYQATGMVSVQLNTRLDEALLRLRAHAFTHGIGVSEVARQVVARRLRFNPGEE